MTEGLGIELRKGVYKYAFMNLDSVGQIRMFRIIVDSEQCLHIHIASYFSVVKPLQLISYHTALIKTAQYGWNVTDEKSGF